MGTQSMTLVDTAARVLDDLDALLEMARELSTVTTLAELRDALAGPLRPLLPSRDISVLRATPEGWVAVVGPDDGPERIEQYAWTPLASEGKTIGMLGIGAPAAGAPCGKVADGTRRMLATAIRNILALDHLKQESVRDSLTGCFTRAHAIEVLEGNLRRANRTGFPVSVLMLDIDDFKAINDGFGHVPGDAVLSAVARELHGMLRQSDLRCRLGGDEFMVILPDTPLEDAVRVAESVRSAIETVAIPSPRGTIKVTASIGVAASVCGSPVDVAAFIDRADVALYQAKKAGRNCVQACATGTGRTRHTTLRLAASA